MSQTLWVTAIILKISQWEKSGEVEEEFSRSGARGGWKRLPGRCLATKGQVFFSPYLLLLLLLLFLVESLFCFEGGGGGVFGQGGSSKGVEEGLDPTLLYEDDGEFMGQSMSEGERRGNQLNLRVKQRKGKARQRIK